MSLDIKVYCNQLSDDLIPKIVKRLNDYDMVVEVDPEFSFSDQVGFLPFKFRLTETHLDILKDKELKSGFELYIDDFDLQTTKQNLKPKPGFLEKFLGKKQPDIPFGSEDIEKRLKDCKQLATFVWHAGDRFELRFSLLTSAILTELTDGVCTYPADNIWYDNKSIVADAFKEIKEYEGTLKERDLTYAVFEEW